MSQTGDQSVKFIVEAARRDAIIQATMNGEHATVCAMLASVMENDVLFREVFFDTVAVYCSEHMSENILEKLERRAIIMSENRSNKN